MVPEALRPSFWDVCSDSFDPESYPQYTVLRILEFGEAAAVQWLRGLFSDAVIREVIRSERRLSRRSANFWAMAYELEPTEVEALRQPLVGG